MPIMPSDGQREAELTGLSQPSGPYLQENGQSDRRQAQNEPEQHCHRDVGARHDGDKCGIRAHDHTKKYGDENEENPLPMSRTVSRPRSRPAKRDDQLADIKRCAAKATSNQRQNIAPATLDG